MRIQGIYAAIATADIAAAESFYTKLFDRGPDDRPMDNLIQWRNVAGANIQIIENQDNAGSSMCTIVVPDMSEARTSLKAVGLFLDNEQEGDFGKIAKLSDPDGNQITLAEPPKQAKSS
ncbi:VOC family protein [Mesorhizobium sp. 2RAF45]|uniref:VOC family protein n=1 Tax=Mesorhizobium sp. 2RAF45 TaxID=3233001 RepID=UPI003F973CCE